MVSIRARMRSALSSASRWPASSWLAAALIISSARAWASSTIELTNSATIAPALFGATSSAGSISRLASSSVPGCSPGG
jgi:hypothetical protein